MTGPGPGDRGRRDADRPDWAERLVSAGERAAVTWRGLRSERRLALLAAFGLFVSLFLPWYQETVIAGGMNGLRSASASLDGWQAFSVAEAVVLLVGLGIPGLLWTRVGAGRLDAVGGDGGVVTGAGVLVCVLVVWRMFDKQGTSGHGEFATASGIEWGIFIALAFGALLTWAGTRIRGAGAPGAAPGGGTVAPAGGAPAPAAGPAPGRPGPGAGPGPGSAAEAARRRIRPRSVAEPTIVRTPVEPSADDQLTVPLDPPA